MSTAADDGAPTGHLDQAEEVRLRILRSLTPVQRLDQARRLRRSMLQLLEAGIRARNPAWDEEQVRRAMASTILHART
jgi:hypothetical protein